MSNNLELINIDSELSKNVLNSIIKREKIEFKRLKIQKLKKQIHTIRNEYLLKEKKSKKDINYYKYQIFWELIKKKFKDTEIIFKKRSQKEKEEKVHVLFSDFNKALGFTPSLLFLLIFSKKIKEYIKINELYQKIKKILDSEDLNNEDKIKFLNLVSKKKITLVTPLCPDYEHIKIGNGFYKYTFNKLNDGLGLIGKRFISIMNKLHHTLDQNNIKFKHYLLYGDFESYSENICDRLKVSEKQFISKIKLSVKKMKKNTNNKCRVGLIVKNLSSKKNWIKNCKLNENKIFIKAKKDVKFRKKIEEIARSRAMLYSSWFPNLNKENYNKLVVKQGAEYTSMGDLFKKKFKNPIVLGLDHPKMKKFYNINSKITVIYGKPRYV